MSHDEKLEDFFKSCEKKVQEKFIKNRNKNSLGKNKSMGRKKADKRDWNK